MNFCLHYYCFTKKLYFFGAFYQQSAQSSLSLVAYKYDTVSAVPKVML